MNALSTAKTTFSLKSIWTDFKEITKMGLSISVVISALAGYLLAVNAIDYVVLIKLALGGYFMVGASNAFNQIIERDLDALMDRTKNRPIATGKMPVNVAFGIASTLTIIGLTLLYNINAKTAMWGAISIFLYTCAYTPLKTKTPLSVFVGAIPGAIPFMLGWVAATGKFGIEAGILFAIQFFWQFPHFWSLGWYLYDDYQKGGFLMLPTGKKDKGTAVQIILYTIWTVLVSILPVFNFSGKLQLSIFGAGLLIVLGLIMISYAFRLFQARSTLAARELMLAMVSYITLLQIIYVADKFLN